MKSNMLKLDNRLSRSEYTSSDHTVNELDNSDPKKAKQMKDIPVKISRKYKGSCNFFHTS